MTTPYYAPRKYRPDSFMARAMADWQAAQTRGVPAPGIAAPQHPTGYSGQLRGQPTDRHHPGRTLRDPNPSEVPERW